VSGFTPGPWRYQGELEREPGLPPRITYEIYTAAGKFGHPASCDREADARLIAAAPELLEALKTHGHGKGLVSCVNRPEPCPGCFAIAKAEGPR
jgi:hypothetical protein